MVVVAFFFFHPLRGGFVRLHRKHERCSKISGIVFFLCAAGIIAHTAAKDGAGYVEDFDKKIKEKHIALDSIKEELIKGREKLRFLQQAEGSCVMQLEQMGKNIEIAESYLKELNTKIDSTSGSIKGLEISLNGETDRLFIRQEEMRKRLRAIYKAGQLDLPQVILSSGSMSDILHRMRYFESLHDYDMRLISGIDSIRTGIKVKKETLEKVQVRLSALKIEKEKEHSSLSHEQAERKLMLDSLRTQKAGYVAMIKELEAAQAELKNIVAMLINRKKKVRSAVKEQGLTSVFEKRKGFLPWPVHGKIVSEFGKVVHSVYKTVVMNTGIDIETQKGEKVTSIAAGSVAYVGWMRGFGRFVIIDHGGYYSTYAHIENVLVDKDEEVKSGTVLGSVEDGGVVGGIKLHFEIRKATEAVDPVEWLEKRKR
jgi:murein hydrolase activator